MTMFYMCFADMNGIEKKFKLTTTPTTTILTFNVTLFAFRNNQCDKLLSNFANLPGNYSDLFKFNPLN